MAGFNTVPSVGGGGGQANMTYVASIHMSTYNRSWSKAGAAGYYAVYSTNQESGYAYFVGAGVTTGISLNKMVNVTHAFTRIDIVGSTNDLISLYKVKVKETSEFLQALPSFPFTSAASKSVVTLTTSGSYVHPTTQGTLGLVNVMIVGAGGGGGGGHGGAHGGGGGGGGGNVVTLNAIPVSASTLVEIGAAGAALGAAQAGGNGGKTYFGNLYAIGGGGGGGWNGDKGATLGNGGGGCAGHATGLGGGGTVQTSSQGLDLGGVIGFHGGRSGGSGHNGTGSGSRGGGGGGAMGDGGGAGDGSGGLGHVSSFTGVNLLYGAGGYGIAANGSPGTDRRPGHSSHYGCGGQGSNGASGGQTGYAGDSGIVHVGVYTL